MGNDAGGDADERQSDPLRTLVRLFVPAATQVAQRHVATV
jgi:hypothetical protein